MRNRRQIFLLRSWFSFLILLIMGGLYGLYQVFTKGLIVTNLTDLVPWGLWITIDLSSIAMAAGAFSLCALVYLVGLKEYEPVAKTATFVGIVGYSMAMLCLLMDVGRPDRFWHGFVYWNTHSVLWEVTMCVGLYFSVLILEVMPIFGGTAWMQENFPWVSGLMVKVHHFSPVLAIFGLGFSLLHQSSLGATYGVLQARPIWYRPSVSVLFIYSAVLGGISLTIAFSMFAARLTPRAWVNDRLLEKLAKAIGWGLLGYLYFRFWDSFAMTYTYQPGRAEGLQLLTRGNLAFNFWVGEIGLGLVFPIIVLLNGRLRRNKSLRMVALFFVAAGVVAYRWNTNLVGQLIVLTYLPHEIEALYTTYFPSAIEFLTSGGVIGYGLLALTVGVRYLRIVDHRIVAHHSEEKTSHPVGQTAAVQAD